MGAKKMFEKKKQVAMKIQMPDGTVKEVSFTELALSTNLASQALVKLLIKKGVITADEFMDSMQEMQKTHYKDAEKKD
jgi:ABC-type Fe2+-enterobactin transport system substrate-binding protein